MNAPSIDQPADQIAQLKPPKQAGMSMGKIAWRSLRRNPLAMFGLIGLVLIALITIFAPLIAPADPLTLNYSSVTKPPAADHLFGTDDLGRDIFSRVLWGGRESLRVALIATVISWTGGIVIGLVSGYYGGLIDSLFMRFFDVLMAFPGILLLLSIVAVLGPGLETVLIALGLAEIPFTARLTRGMVLSARNRDYVFAAVAVGARANRVMFRHILPNIIPVLIIYSTVGLGGTILTTAGLSYIGLGAQPPTAEWGAMLNYGRTYLRTAWWMSVFPGLAIFLTVLFVNLLGDGLRDALDPRLKT